MCIVWAVHERPAPCLPCKGRCLCRIAAKAKGLSGLPEAVLAPRLAKRTLLWVYSLFYRKENAA